MISEDVLREALIMAYDQETDVLERQAALEGLHTFSESYRARMQRIAYMAKRRYVTVMHKRRRLILVVAAVVIMMIAAAVTTLAIVRPQIFYKITKEVGAWKYKFSQEDPNEMSKGFIYKKPKVPKRFSVYDSYKDEEMYVICYSDDDGQDIRYEQSKFNSSMSLYMTDTAGLEKVMIQDKKADLYYEEGQYTIIWNDGISIYMLSWIGCTKKEIIELASTV